MEEHLLQKLTIYPQKVLSSKITAKHISEKSVLEDCGENY